MTGERRNKREKIYISDWVARAVGVTSVATMLMIPAMTQQVDTGAQQFNPGISYEPNPDPVAEIHYAPTYNETIRLTRDTGMDTQPCRDYEICGTDLGQPFLLPDGSVGYLLGDTFAVKGPFLRNVPPGADKYRAQAMLRSNKMPIEGEPITFDGAAGLEDKGTAPDLLGGWNMLMNDGVSLPNGDVIVSYQHTISVEGQKEHVWYTDRSSLAISHDGGNTFEKTGPDWENNENNTDPYQMWSMQRDGDYVYIVSVAAGRQPGPMMLFRSRWDQMLDKSTYTYWNGTDWGEKANATPIMQGHFGEPSLRKLSDDTWILGYADYSKGPKIVTQIVEDPTEGPEGQWSEPKVHLTWKDLPNPYGGYPHPYSTKENLVLMVSTWQMSPDRDEEGHGEPIRYDISHLNTSA